MMKKYILSTAFILFIACNSNQKNYMPAENALDAGREFIDACLKGDFIKADFYVLHDAVNDSLFAIVKKDYALQTNEEKKQYRNASITILSVENISGDATVIAYSNSFNKTTHTLKVVNNKGFWQTDLKYTIKGNL